MLTLQNSFSCAFRGILILLLISAPLLSVAGLPSVKDGNLLETGSPSTPKTPTASPGDIKIVSYNMRWRGGAELRRLIELFKHDNDIGGAAIIGLQEVDRNKKRTGYVNTVRQLAEELGMYYVWAAPPAVAGNENREEETGVAILSSYPLTDVRRIVLPNEGPGGRRRAAIGATVQLGLHETIRIYSIHAETRITNEKRLEQFTAVLDDLRTHHSPAQRSVVLGDFNTITGKDVRATSHLFKEKGFRTPFPDDLATWRTFIIELKLDWVWLRGVEVRKYGIAKKVGLSDHWPLWAVVSMKKEKD